MNTAAAARRPFALARVAIEQPVTDKLLKLSATDPDDLVAVLGAAWALLLRCYTGQDDVSFGFERAGDVTGAEPVLAHFLLDDSASVAGTVDHAKTELAGDRTSPPSPPIATSPVPVPAGDHPVPNTTLALWGFAPTAGLDHSQILAPVTSSPPRCLTSSG